MDHARGKGGHGAVLTDSRRAHTVEDELGGDGFEGGQEAVALLARLRSGRASGGNSLHALARHPKQQWHCSARSRGRNARWRCRCGACFTSEATRKAMAMLLPVSLRHATAHDGPLSVPPYTQAATAAVHVHAGTVRAGWRVVRTPVRNREQVDLVEELAVEDKVGRTYIRTATAQRWPRRAHRPVPQLITSRPPTRQRPLKATRARRSSAPEIKQLRNSAAESLPGMRGRVKR